MPLKRLVTLGAAAMILIGSDLPAQDVPADCEKVVANALATPPRVNLRELHKCPGKFGPTMATLLGNYSLVSDTPTYSGVVSLAAFRREADIFYRALDIAIDEAAPPVARAGAMAILVSYRQGARSFPYQNELVGSHYDDPSLCWNFFRGGSEAGDVPLPEDHLTLSGEVATLLIESGAPSWLRYMAYCLSRQPYVEPVRLPPPSNAPSDSLRDFDYVKLCGRKFLIRNKLYRRVSVSVMHTIPGSSVNRKIVLPPREPGSAYSELELIVPDADNEVTLWQLDAPINIGMVQTTVNSDPC